MRPIRVYADTSVFGGTEDEEFRDPSRRFFDAVRSGRFVILISEETARELQTAPDAVRNLPQTLPKESIDTIEINAEVLSLARMYLDAAVLGQSSKSDAIHVAAASVAGADLILSWNFKHIVNFDRIRGFNGVNTTNGYRTMTILSPMEVCHEDEE
jgi:predicted nucleic acid-binding protein